MSQTVIDNINNYTIEIVDNSLILTPKNNIYIAFDTIKVGKTIILNDVKYIVTHLGNSLLKRRPLMITCKNNENKTEIICISKDQRISIDNNNNIILIN
jgi:hypothetical protein